jgi:hypothetical protein
MRDAENNLVNDSIGNATIPVPDDDWLSEAASYSAGIEWCSCMMRH